MTRYIAITVGVLLASSVPTGCSSARRTGPYQTSGDAQRNTVLAESLTQRAATLIGRDASRAEELLREALTADIFYGPAHNNLGVLLLSSGDLAGAATEFQWAAKLLPDNADPRLNLAITLERAGRIDEALSGYAAVLEVTPDHIPTMQAMAICQSRHDRYDDRTPYLLREIAMRGESDTWKSWARTQMAMLDVR
jgi:tetratricopeptide (TPR) repeat protein